MYLSFFYKNIVSRNHSKCYISTIIEKINFKSNKNIQNKLSIPYVLDGLRILLLLYISCFKIFSKPLANLIKSFKLW